jgi:chromate reductase
MKTLTILGISATWPDGCESSRILQVVEECLPVEATLKRAETCAVPPYDFRLRGREPRCVEDLLDAVNSADGILFNISQENFSIPVRLSNAIEWISRSVGTGLLNKPVALISISKGMLGGVCAQTDLRRQLETCGANVLLAPEVAIGLEHMKFDESGCCTHESTQRLIERQMLEFRNWIYSFQVLPHQTSEKLLGEEEKKGT